MQKSDNWTIWLAERPVFSTAPEDMYVFGTFFSHPFLVFKTPGNDVIAEMQGSWSQNIAAYPACYLINKFTTAARSDKAARVLRAAASPVFPRASLELKKGAYNAHHFVSQNLLFEGARESACDIWQKLHAQLPRVNDMRLPYYKYAKPSSGFANSQRVLRLALECAQVFKKIPDLKLAQTGWTVPSKGDITLKL